MKAQWMRFRLEVETGEDDVVQPESKTPQMLKWQEERPASLVELVYGEDEIGGNIVLRNWIPCRCNNNRSNGEEGKWDNGQNCFKGVHE